MSTTLNSANSSSYELEKSEVCQALLIKIAIFALYDTTDLRFMCSQPGAGEREREIRPSITASTFWQ